MASRKTIQRMIGTTLVAGFGMASLVVGLPSVASAAPGDTSGGTTTANVDVGSSIALTDLTPAFTLTGNPGDLAVTATPVTMVVSTNNFAGYTVSVQAAADALAPSIAGNTDSIPIAALKVRETGTTPWSDSSSAVPVVVHSQATQTAEAGDTISNDYSMTIPFVREDLYTVNLNYLATTL